MPIISKAGRDGGSILVMQRREKIRVSKPERTLRDKDEEQRWCNNGDRVDSLNLGVMLAYLPGPSGHHNLFE